MIPSPQTQSPKIVQHFYVPDFDHRRALTSLLQGVDLAAEEARAWLEAAVAGEVSDSVMAGILVALQAKRPSGSELAEMARVLRGKCVAVEAPQGAIDTCGTGGGPATYNISTAVAILASAAGAVVAKHGNRAVTSSCGSADVLECLGVRLVAEPDRLTKQLSSIGIAFLFAQNHHPSLKAIGKVRRELGVRTVFNVLGPLSNPAKVRRQIIGLYEAGLMAPVAAALMELGCDRGMVVHAANGMDEISPVGETMVKVIEDGSIRDEVLSMTDFGLCEVDFESISAGDSAEGNAEKVVTAITQADSRVAVPAIAGASAALWIAGLATDFRAGAEMARAAIASGAARQRLDELIEATNEDG